MTQAQKLAKAEKDYYASIEVTHAEYRDTIATAKKHHQHRFKRIDGHIGVVFYECACGSKHATVLSGDENGKSGEKG